MKTNVSFERAGTILSLALVALAWSAPAWGSNHPIKIGSLGPHHGVYGIYGNYQDMAATLFAEEINKQGGLLGRKVEVISEETEIKPSVGARKTEKLILEDKVDLIQGAVSSGVTLAVMEVTRKYRKLHINAISCAEFMRTTKFHPHYFTFLPDNRMQAEGLVDYILQKMGKRVFIFYVDYAMGQSDARVFKYYIEKKGGEVVGLAAAPTDTKDFSPWFGQIRAAKPDVLFPAFAGNDSLRLITQLHKFGLSKEMRIAAIDCFVLENQVPEVAQAMEGVVQLSHTKNPEPNPLYEEFQKKWQARWNNIPTYPGTNTYRGLQFWAAAVKKAGTTDSDKVAKAMEGLTLMTDMGQASVRPEDHAIVIDMTLVTYSEGKYVPLEKKLGPKIVGEPLPGKDPLPGFVWDIKKK